MVVEVYINAAQDVRIDVHVPLLLPGQPRYYGMDYDVAVHLGPVPAEAGLGQLLALPCVVALKLFVLIHGPCPVISSIQGVDRFGKSRCMDFVSHPKCIM